MSRPHRSAAPWHPAWRSSPLLGTQRQFWWLPAAVTGGQPLVCLRSLLAALGLTWPKWGGAVRQLARTMLPRALRGLSPRSEPSLLLPAQHMPLFLERLIGFLAPHYPAGSRRVQQAAGFWAQTARGAQALDQAAIAVRRLALGSRETVSQPSAAAPGATGAAAGTPGAALRAARGRRFLRPADLPGLQAAACRLRQGGCTWAQIGQQLGVHETTALRIANGSYAARIKTWRIA